jgi:hopanoid biosynthesis associated RND transporter like protein HpnN
MPSIIFAKIVEFCIRRPWLIVLASLLILAGSAVYVERHFAINTDVNTLLSPDLPWRQRQSAFDALFPGQATSIIAVVSAPTPEFAGAAAEALTDRLAPQTNRFHWVSSGQGGPFFTRNGLLYLSPNDLTDRMTRLTQAVPLIRVLAADPSLRGLSQALSMSLQGVAVGRITLDAMAKPLTMAADAIENVLAGRPSAFSWQVLVSGAPATPGQLNQIVAMYPVLDYGALQPGKRATAAVGQAATDAHLQSKYQAAVHLTGTIPLADAQFATLQQGVVLNGVTTGAIILFVLWLALRWLRIVIPVVITIFVGLVATAALGLILAGAFNPISVAFAMLFVGLGADFAIQFGVRYRAQRHALGELHPALVDGVRYVGAPLTLAALAAAAGFLSFVPTDYRGVAELGLIAGVGMIVGYVFAMTLLPALLALFRPPAEPHPLGYAAMAGADRFMHRHRVAIVAGTALLVLAALPSLVLLKFNFDPNSLQIPDSEAVATLNMLSRDTNVKFETANVLTSPAEAADVVKRVSALPLVQGTQNINSFIPADQPQKIATIGKVAAAIDPALHARPAPKPSDADNVAALKGTANGLQRVAGNRTGAGPDAARRLAKDLDTLAGAPAQTRNSAQAVFVIPLQANLAQLAASLHPQTVTQSDLPADLVRQWVASNGLWRTEIVPKASADDTMGVRRFAEQVLSVEPNATGAAIQVYEWGSTVTSAFIRAGLLAICLIALLLVVILRRFTDMLVTLIPLLVAAAATLEICALSGFALNYANIIALPALLGVGVAFKIYYVMAWRRGEYNFLQSSLTRAVFFSALMTATAFGSLWFSAHPGISSMGKLLALSLACTLASAALFQPALMGPPRSLKVPDPAGTDKPTS